MRKPIHVLVVLQLILVVLVCGCTMTIKAPRKPVTEYPRSEKIDLRVGLELSEDLQKAQIEQKALDGTRFLIPLGPNLAMNAQEMTRITFRDVKVASTTAELKAEKLDAILSPKFASGEYQNVAGIINCKLEWTLSDLGGNPIWAGTASGEARRTSTFMYNPENTVRDAIRGLFTNSHRLILSAPEIKQYKPAK